MVCQYSTHGLVSSEKRETTSETEVEKRGGGTAGVAIIAVVMGGYCSLLDPCPYQLFIRSEIVCFFLALGPC
jgi:hypothetical protein